MNRKLSGQIIILRTVLRSGTNTIGRYGNGKFYMSSPSPSVPKGRHPDSTITIGSEAEPVELRADGREVLIHIGDDMLRRIIQHKGYAWNTETKGKPIAWTITYDNALTAAIARLRECTKANVGR